MPKSFAGAGVLPSTLLLLFLMAMGYTTATFMVEAMALSNYILKTDEDGNAIDEGQQVDSSGEEDGEVDEIDGHGDSSRRGHRGKLGREPRHRFTRVGSFDGSDARRSRQLDEPQRYAHLLCPTTCRKLGAHVSLCDVFFSFQCVCTLRRHTKKAF